MILFKILDHDLHRSRSAGRVPLFLYVPALPSFVPAVVSTIQDKDGKARFVISRRLFEDGDVKAVKTFVFQYDSDRLDEVLRPLFDKAFELSEAEKWPNVFRGRGPASRAFDYVQASSGLKGQPHVCLVPKAWGRKRTSSFFGSDYDASKSKYRGVCRVVPADVGFPVFLSRPDMVGMYTQFMGGGTSIVLHNVKLGTAFCPVAGPR